MKSRNLTVHTDAASRGNPGPSSIAYCIKDSSGKILEEKGKYIGKGTNNTAEYKAMVAALGAASKYSSGEVRVFSDSQILVRQMNGKYKVKAKHLKDLFQDAKQKQKKFKRVTYNHLPREDPEISKMDRLANKVLDLEGK